MNKIGYTNLTIIVNGHLKKVVKIKEAAQRLSDKKLFDSDEIGRVLFIGGW